MATTSQKMMEIRFLVRMRGALTPPPRMEEPVMKMPLIESGCQQEAKLTRPRTNWHIPCCANHRESYAEGDAQVCPRVRRDGFEEGADLDVRVSRVLRIE
jgi:hypothetical protein